MATDSVAERIVEWIVTQLTTICTADGYHNDVDADDVIRPDRTGDGYAPVDNGIAVITGDLQRMPEHDFIGNPGALGWRLPVQIDWIVRRAADDEESQDQLNLRAISDVLVALSDITCGGLSINADAEEITQGGIGAGQGVTVTWAVEFRTSENDPATQR